MTTDGRNRPDSKFTTNDWLTPPDILSTLGPFDLDPACHPAMPWRTAARMISWEKPRPNVNDDTFCEHGNGLSVPWVGRVWCNPPYDDIMPWVMRHTEHRNGLLLVPAKSTDSKWGQAAIGLSDATLFIAGRLLFYYPDGTVSKGKWSPSMINAWGAENVLELRNLRNSSLLPGTLMGRMG